MATLEEIKEMAVELERIIKSAEWRKVRRKYLTVGKNARKFNKRSVPLILGLFMDQHGYDRALLKDLEKSAEVYNEAVQAYRAEHGVTPIASYLFRPVEEWAIEYQLGEQRWDIAFKTVKDVIDETEKIQGIRPTQYKKVYCGFCGEYLDDDASLFEENDKFLMIDDGIGIDYSCLEDECVKAATHYQAYKQLPRMLVRNVFHQVELDFLAREFGREQVTEAQAPLLREEFHKRVRAKAMSFFGQGE